MKPLLQSFAGAVVERSISFSGVKGYAGEFNESWVVRRGKLQFFCSFSYDINKKKTFTAIDEKLYYAQEYLKTSAVDKYILY